MPVSQELVDIVAFNLSKGESREDITEYLSSQGLNSEEIEAVFAKVPKPVSLWQQLPIYPYFAALDAKTARLPARVVLGISGIMIVVMVAIFYFAYILVNPTGSSSEKRDKDRQIAKEQLEISLNNYFLKKGYYPNSISEMVPEYINSVPVDPKSLQPYYYFTVNGGRVYNLCVYFETKSAVGECLNNDVLNLR